MRNEEQWSCQSWFMPLCKSPCFGCRSMNSNHSVNEMSSTVGHHQHQHHHNHQHLQADHQDAGRLSPRYETPGSRSRSQSQSSRLACPPGPIKPGLKMRHQLKKHNRLHLDELRVIAEATLLPRRVVEFTISKWMNMVKVPSITKPFFWTYRNKSFVPSLTRGTI